MSQWIRTSATSETFTNLDTGVCLYPYENTTDGVWEIAWRERPGSSTTVRFAITTFPDKATTASAIRRMVNGVEIGDLI